MTDSEPIEIYIEWPEQYGIQKASIGENIEELKEQSQRAINLAMSSVRAMAYKVSRTIKEIENDARPDEIEVEFSIKLDCESGVVVPMIAKASAGGQFAVKFKWTIEKPEQTKVIFRTDA